MSQLDQTPYRQELVFRSGTFTDPPRAGIRITERDTPRPATCVALLERAGARAGLTGSPHRLPSEPWRSSRCPRSSTSRWSTRPSRPPSPTASASSGATVASPGPRSRIALGGSPPCSRAAGLGTHRALADCAAWESPHDHVALYLHNGNEYLEALLGAAKARAVGVNINYRYVADELRYVLDDARARAVVYHGAFAATLAQVLPGPPRRRAAPPGRRRIGRGAAPRSGRLRGGAGRGRAIAAGGALARRPLHPLHRRHHGDAQGRALAPGRLPRRLPRRGAAPPDDLVAAAGRADLRTLPAPPFMHGAAHWNAISAWLAGGTVVIQDRTPVRLDPIDLLDTVEAERVTSLLIVGDAFARPLVDELQARPRQLDLLRFLLTGGAVLSATVKAQLLELVPQLRIVDVLGSSETGRQGVHQSDQHQSVEAGTFGPSPTAEVLSADRQPRARARRPRARLAGPDRPGAPGVPGRSGEDRRARSRRSAASGTPWPATAPGCWPTARSSSTGATR